MSKAKRTLERAAASRRATESRTAAAGGWSIWYWLAIAFGSFVLLYVIYDPALRGPFVFDDPYLPFMASELTHAGLKQWIAGVRPFLMFSFWLNHVMSGTEPYSYHFANVVLHFITGILAFLIVRRLLGRAGTAGYSRDLISAFAGLLFLVHPLQTESVAYVASRSEALSVMFFYGAFAAFLYRRREAITWLESLAIIVLFIAAAMTKEHTAVLPALLLLTDYYWNPGFSFKGIRRNWRLYGLIAAAGAGALWWVYRVLRSADTAGFHVKDLNWYEYFFTQCRVIWLYIRMFLLPFGQSVDHDFAISRTIIDRGAFIGLAALFVATAAAVWYRRKYPLASYGWLTFLLLIAPTSSFVPIADVVAERRAYLPFIGLLLIAAELIRNWKASRTAVASALAGVIFVMAWVAYDRNKVWGSAEALWTDTAAKAPEKSRPHFQLGFVYFSQGRCNLAVPEFEKAARYGAADYRLLIDWGLAYDCAGNTDEALRKLEQAAAVSRTAHVYSLIGREYAKAGRRVQASDALNTAVALDPAFDMTYVYRAALYADQNDLQAAVAEYRRALGINPENEAALQGLSMVQQKLRGGR